MADLVGSSAARLLSGLGCPPGTGRLCRPRPGAVRNERAWPARSQHPPRQDLAWAISAGLRDLDRTGRGAAARARPQDEGRARRRRGRAKAALRESGGVARAAVYWSKIFCSTPPPRRFRRARPSWARWGLRKAMRAAPTLAGRPRARLRTAPEACLLLVSLHDASFALALQLAQRA